MKPEQQMLESLLLDIQIVIELAPDYN